MATQPTVQYGDKITAGYAPGQSGTAVYDPNTGKPLAGAQTYNPNTGKAITSELLKNRPTLILPDAPNYSYGGVQGATEALTNQTRSAEQLARDEAKANSDSSLQQLIQETLNAGNISSSVDRTAQNEAKQRSDLYTSQLEQEQLANRRAIEAIQSGAGIKTAAQRDAEAADINRKSLSKQADIAILQTAANRDYETAASIADRQVALKLEQSNARLAALKFFYENNKADFNKQDDRLYANKIKEEERAYKKQEDNLNDIKNLKLTLAKNGAPASALASLDESKDLAEALNNPKITQYFTSPADKLDLQLKRQQLTNARLDTQKKQQDLNPTSSSNNPVIATILGSGKFTKDQAAAITSAINSGEDPATVIKNQAKNIMGQTEATKLTGYEVAKSQIEDLQSNLNKYYALGGKTSILKGNYEKVINKLGNVNDPALVGIATQISASLQQYRNAVSGTAYSVKEGQEIASVFPGINKSQGLNDAIINGRIKAFNSTIDSTYRSAIGNAYDSLNKADTATDNYFESSLNALNATSVTTKEDSFLQKLYGNLNTNTGRLQ